MKDAKGHGSAAHGSGIDALPRRPFGRTDLTQRWRVMTRGDSRMWADRQRAKLNTPERWARIRAACSAPDARFNDKGRLVYAFGKEWPV